MPLIIITGLPTSGKTTRARQLYDYLSARLGSQSSPQHQPQQGRQQQQQSPSPNPSPNLKPPYRLHLISDSTLSIPRTVYDLSPTNLPAHVRSANAAEKDARAAIYGAVKRVLSPRDIVILDGLNYIKGWRYQLYCEAKNVRTASCVLQIGAGVERARQVNEARLARRKAAREGGQPGSRPVEGEGGGEEQGENADETGAPQPSGQQAPEQQPQQEQQPEQQTGEGPGEPPQDVERKAELQYATAAADDEEEPYEPSNWDNLVFRYEEPNAMNRWDSPLFTLIWDDDEAQTRAVFDKIWDAIAGEGRKPVRPNQSTVQRDKDPGGDYLYVLERETQDIVKKILERQPDEGGGTVILPQAVGKLAAERLRESFVGYLNDMFEKDG
ncbi:hypothetical protein VTH82DRAFT_616 [Thermothelomyces myriococcoides]